MTAPRTLHHLCYACGTSRRHAFAGYATDGAEQTADKPRAAHYRCSTCGRTILTLGNVYDAEGLCVTVAKRRIHADARGVETEDAVAFLYWHIWRLYLSWQPHRLSFLSYASHWLPRRLDAFVYDATGDAPLAADGSRRRGRRGEPKPQSVSVSYDALIETGQRSALAVEEHGIAQGDIHRVGGRGAASDIDRVSGSWVAAALGRPHESGMDELVAGDTSHVGDDSESDLGRILGVADRDEARRAS